MTINVPPITKLPTDATEINTIECISYLQDITKNVNNKNEAEHLLQHINAVIKKESGDYMQNENKNVCSNQTVLNLAFRSYYKLLGKYAISPHECYEKLVAVGENEEEEEEMPIHSMRYFQILYAILLSRHWDNPVAAEKLFKKCMHALQEAIRADSQSVLGILKILNLFLKKYSKMNPEFDLEAVYHCLQHSGQNGMREETLIYFTHCCMTDDRALHYFQIISNYWPWTNRNKYYLLSCILIKQNLNDLLKQSEQCAEDFFAGLRLSLSYKSLLAASQYLVKSLSKQESSGLLELCAIILKNGNLKEIQNFYSQWFSRISQKDQLFEMVHQQLDVEKLIQTVSSVDDHTEQYRFILIFHMFSKQIVIISRLHFFKISTELITNCFQYELEAQILIYKFLIDNLHNFAIEDCLEFIGKFYEEHKEIDNALMRNSILNKLSTVINYVAKIYCKTKDAVAAEQLAQSIKMFFQRLHHIIDANLDNEIYQPKIFALKLLEILLSSIYAEELQKNAKNCSVTQNQQLGIYLIGENVFQPKSMIEKLFNLLNDPFGFDDALDLVVKLLRKLQPKSDITELALKQCKEKCQNLSVDECMLSSLYAQVTLQFEDRTIDVISDLWSFAATAINTELKTFKLDPLLVCKTRSHLLGFLNVLNLCVSSTQVSSLSVDYAIVLDLLEEITEDLLQKLHLANLNDDHAASASFQDMDESLELLIQSSEYKTVGNHDECRKFLLMSFWLTLKACSDLATTLGCFFVTQNTVDIKFLQRCLQINVNILTRCRHKGAIEAAGLSIGKLAKCITSKEDSTTFNLLNDCLDSLFIDGKQVSTTRRGAGYSIMFLHIVKNEQHPQRPILKRITAKILQQLEATSKENINTQKNCDRPEALTLHYLCVLVKDTELRDSMSSYYNEIILAAIAHIDNPEWTICNAALQLFGAIIPKIIGQKQATEFEAPLDWETTEITYNNIFRTLPHICKYILKYCTDQQLSSCSTRSIILFLGFLSNVEHLQHTLEKDEKNDEMLEKFRELMWSLLRHNCQKVRQLAALCFVRLHEFHIELPHILVKISNLLFNIKNENFFEGLLYTLKCGILKLKHEALHTIGGMVFNDFLKNIQEIIINNFNINSKFKLYTYTKLLEIFLTLGFKIDENPILALLNSDKIDNKAEIGFDIWMLKVTELSK